jgi:hypothetical protein
LHADYELKAFTFLYGCEKRLLTLIEFKAHNKMLRKGVGPKEDNKERGDLFRSPRILCSYKQTRNMKFRV